MDEALLPAEASLVHRVQHELITVGTMTDATWFQLNRTMGQLSEEDLGALIETLARTSATLRPTDARDMAGPGTTCRAAVAPVPRHQCNTGAPS